MNSAGIFNRNHRKLLLQKCFEKSDNNVRNREWEKVEKMTTKVEQTSQHHQPFKSLSDTDLTIVSTGDVTGSDKKRVTIKDASFDSCTTDSMSSEQAKSKTLPAKTKLALTLKRTNSLKRSITLPRSDYSWKL